MGGLLIFLLIQVIVNLILRNTLYPFIADSGLIGIITYYMISSLLISFFGALLQTPSVYRKDFYRQPAFHKTMLTYFTIFFVIDLIFVFIA